MSTGRVSDLLRPQAETGPEGGEGANESLIEQLRMTLGRMELAFGLLDEAACMTDIEGRVKWCNAAFCRLVGRKQFRILGQPAAELLPLSAAGKRLDSAAHPLSMLLANTGSGSVRGRYELDRAGSVPVPPPDPSSSGRWPGAPGARAARDVPPS